MHFPTINIIATTIDAKAIVRAMTLLKVPVDNSYICPNPTAYQDLNAPSSLGLRHGLEYVVY